MIAEVCHCGHDIATHHKHENERVNCLGMCCDCKRYVHRDKPLPKVKPARPAHPYWCECAVCKLYKPEPMDQEFRTPLMPLPFRWP